MIEFKNKTVWITGASSGIGKALSIKLSSLGANVILSSRKKEELDIVAKHCINSTMVLPIDLENQQQFSSATKSVIEKFGKNSYNRVIKKFTLNKMLNKHRNFINNF